MLRDEVQAFAARTCFFSPGSRRRFSAALRVASRRSSRCSTTLAVEGEHDIADDLRSALGQMEEVLADLEERAELEDRDRSEAIG